MTLYSNCLSSNILSSTSAKTHPSQTLSCLLCDVSHWIIATLYLTNLGHSPNLSLPIQDICPSLLFFLEIHCHFVTPKHKLCYYKNLPKWFRVYALKKFKYNLLRSCSQLNHGCYKLEPF